MYNPMTSTIPLSIEMAWYDMHSETFYSFINEICLCNASKDPFAFSNDDDEDDEYEEDPSYLGLTNNSNYIFICHEEDLFLEENATNVYFLTPRHKRHILPSYFPPTYTTAQVESRGQANHKPPIFLVLGAFFDYDKRNVPSLFN